MSSPVPHWCWELGRAGPVRSEPTVLHVKQVWINRAQLNPKFKKIMSCRVSSKCKNRAQLNPKLHRSFIGSCCHKPDPYI
jgi:hypothetical protein